MVIQLKDNFELFSELTNYFVKRAKEDNLSEEDKKNGANEREKKIS
jgi:hypothetical protein